MKKNIYLGFCMFFLFSCQGENYPRTFSYQTFTSPSYESYVITSNGLSSIELPENLKTALFENIEPEVRGLFGEFDITIDSETEITFSRNGTIISESYQRDGDFIIPETFESMEHPEGSSELTIWTWSEGNITLGIPRLETYFSYENEIDDWKERLESTGSIGDTIYGYKSFIVFQ